MSHLQLSFVVVLLFGRKVSLGEDLRVQNHYGFGYELIQFKLEYLESSIVELKTQMEDAQQQFNDNVDRKFTQLEKEIKSFLGDKVSQLTDQISKLQTRLLDPICQDLPKTKSGKCLMDIGGNVTVVYQDHRFGDDWLVVLQRSDGSENFNRNWADYRDGFGTAGQEYWLGLEKLHVLTKNGSYELLFVLEDFSGNSKYARYDKFSIGSEQDLYRLNVLGTYSGTAGDSFKVHMGNQFTALDKGPSIGCADEWTGGWWYKQPRWCYGTHLTGIWQSAERWTSILWRGFGPVEYHALKFARMLIRKT